MIIGLLTPYFPDLKTRDSGIANHCLLLAKGLADTGNKVVILHIRPKYEEEDSRRTEHDIDPHIKVVTYKVAAPGYSGFLKRRWALIDFLIKLKCMRLTSKVLSGELKRHDIGVIETSSYFSLAFFWAFKRSKVPVVVRVSTTFLQIMKDHYPFQSRLLQWIGKMEINFIKKAVI